MIHRQTASNVEDYDESAVTLFCYRICNTSSGIFLRIDRWFIRTAQTFQTAAWRESLEKSTQRSSAGMFEDEYCTFCQSDAVKRLRIWDLQRSSTVPPRSFERFQSGLYRPRGKHDWTHADFVSFPRSTRRKNAGSVKRECPTSCACFLFPSIRFVRSSSYTRRRKFIT